MKNFSKQIDDYLMGKLSPSEGELFENEMRVNPALQKKVDICRELRDSIQETDIHSLREKLNSARYSVKSSNTKWIKLSAYITAASIALLIALRFLVVDSSQNHDLIFSKHFQPFKIVGESRSSLQKESNILSEELISLYINKKYDDVIPIIESYLARYPNNKQASLMLSTAYLGTNRDEKAELILQRLTLDSNNEFYAEAIKWYLSLSIIKQGKLEEAKFILAEIENEKGFYSEKASSILKSL
jgi:hypothetical protein